MMMLTNGKTTMIAYLKLIRIPNLLIIILTQYMLRFCIIRTLYQLQNIDLQIDEISFAILVFITICIAAAGYIINDYFDIDIDEYNQNNNVIGKMVPVRHVWVLYGILNIIAFALGFYLAFELGKLQIGFIFPIISGLLYFYASRYKGMLIWGNLIVSFLSAMVVLIVWLFEFMALRNNPVSFIDGYKVVIIINAFTWGYAAFAFLVTLLRELIKDIQDIDGDTRFGCRTLPIILGWKTTRNIIVVGIIVVMGLLGLCQYYLLKNGYNYPFWYLLITVQPIFIYLIIKVIRASKPGDFKLAGLISKIIMVAGILSMQLVHISYM